MLNYKSNHICEGRSGVGHQLPKLRTRVRFPFLAFFMVSAMLISGCSTFEVAPEYVYTELPEPDKNGVYHKVNVGETIWRIAKTYDVAIDDIIKANNIPNVAKVEKDQLLFIPGAYSQKKIILDTGDNKNEFVWPVKGKVIHYFHQRYGNQINKGIDIQAKDGAPVLAARTGRVVLADYLGGYGHTVILDHLDGFYSVYAHNAKLSVRLDELVLKNKEIALVGKNENQLAYLHFEVRKNSIEDNPLYYLP